MADRFLTVECRECREQIRQPAAWTETGNPYRITCSACGWFFDVKDPEFLAECRAAREERDDFERADALLDEPGAAGCSERALERTIEFSASERVKLRERLARINPEMFDQPARDEPPGPREA